jgi:F-type H+-transporting ATPase subunit gamma
MSKRRDLELHRDSLEEIGEILSSMKTLAYMETRKLSRFLEAENKVVESIVAVAQDFLGFHPELPGALRDATPVFLVVGSERGFCGDFNRALTRRLAEVLHEHEDDRPRVVAVGHKLGLMLDGDASVAAFIDGASVAEEVPSVLQSIIDELDALQRKVGGLALFGIYHHNDDIALAALLPPFAEQPPAGPGFAFAPLLNVPAEDFYGDLVDHYLFAALNHMLYTSLMSENQRRVSHLDGAVRHLDDQSGELTRRCRALRQEEITEEIEVILLSSAAYDGSGV